MGHAVRQHQGAACGGEIFILGHCWWDDQRRPRKIVGVGCQSQVWFEVLNGKCAWDRESIRTGNVLCKVGQIWLRVEARSNLWALKFNFYAVEKDFMTLKCWVGVYI